MSAASVWAVMDIPPRVGYPGGFSARFQHFLSAVGTRWPLDILALRPADAEWGAESFLPPELRACHFWCHSTPAQPLNRLSLQGKLRRAGHYLFDPLPYMSYPRRLRVLKQYWNEHAPRLAVFFLPYTAHLSFELPKHVPCLYVLEEGWERSLQWSVKHLAALPRRWVTATERARVQRLYHRLARRGEQFVVISESEKAWFSRWIPAERITAIPHGLDCEYYTPVAAEPEIDIGVFGLLSAARNYEAMLELHRWIKSRSHSFPRELRWAFVGKAPPDAITALRSSRVMVTGYVPDLRPYYARTKIVVVPSHYGTGVKTTVLEAWAMGRPVVATPFALQGLPARPGENVLVGNSPEELARCIAHLLAKPEQRERLGAAGRQTVRGERDIRDLASRFADVCARALEATPSPVRRATR